MRYLTAAASIFPRHLLVVAVAPDAYIRKHKLREPQWPEADRLEAVLALKVVGRVVLHDVDGVARTIVEQTPDVFVKGSDWKGRLLPDVLAACQRVGCAVVFTKKSGGHTSERLCAIR